MLSILLFVINQTDHSADHTVDVLRSLQGRHWIDGRPEDLPILEKGFKELATSDRKQLYDAVLEYLLFDLGETGEVSEACDSDLLYRRSIDIAVLTSLCYGPMSPSNSRMKSAFGFSKSLRTAPWILSQGDWKLRVNTVGSDATVRKQYRAFEEFAYYVGK